VGVSVSHGSSAVSDAGGPAVKGAVRELCEGQYGSVMEVTEATES
jgi:hypothetical protein